MDPKQRLAQILEEADQGGYQRDDGEFVDPPEAQKFVIEQGFKAAADDPAFDIWTIVNPNVAIREGNTLKENFPRVYDQYEQTVEDPKMKQAVADAMGIEQENGT